MQAAPILLFYVVPVTVPALVIGCCILLLLTSKFQSLLVCVHWLNWPPFDPSEPGRPSPTWAGRWLPCLGLFEGLPQAKPFVCGGTKGTLRGFRVPRLAPGNRVVVYLHGNMGNVALRHRVELYKLLTAPPFCCDVVAVDYAGFGYSDRCWPDENTMAGDALAVLKALPDRREDVIIWGHSLGTGVAVAAIARLLEGNGGAASSSSARLAIGTTARDLRAPLGDSEPGSEIAPEALPRGLILEAPFLSIPDAATGYLSRCRLLPTCFLNRLRGCLGCVVRAHRMPSSERITSIAGRMPVAILHGQRDTVIPFEQGQRLADLAGAPLHAFDCGHEDIVGDPKLLDALKTVLVSFGDGRSTVECGGHLQDALDTTEVSGNLMSGVV